MEYINNITNFFISIPIINLAYNKFISLGVKMKLVFIIVLMIIIYTLYVTNIRHIYKQKKECFFIEGKYSYKQAKNVAYSIDCTLATVEQLNEDFKQGANWCKFGWLDKQIVAYPNQIPSTYCGAKGINGNYQPNINKNYGVVCYGLKPKTLIEQRKKEYSLDKLIKRIRPFDDSYWSINDKLKKN